MSRFLKERLPLQLVLGWLSDHQCFLQKVAEGNLLSQKVFSLLKKECEKHLEKLEPKLENKKKDLFDL